MFQNVTPGRLVGMILCVAAMIIIALSGCSTTKQLEKRSEKYSAERDTAGQSVATRRTVFHDERDSTASEKAAAKTAEKTAQKSSESALNETVETVTTITYDAATGRKTGLTRTSRRVTGTVAKQAESTSEKTTDTTSEKAWALQRQRDFAQADSNAQMFAGHSKLERETKEKTVDKKTEPAVKAWLVGGGVTLLLAAVAWAVFFPSLLGGGPAYWLIGVFRRKKEQTAA